MRTVVLDIEADAIENVKNIWCIVARDIHTKELFKFHPKKQPCPTCNETGLVDGHLCSTCNGELSIYKGNHEEWKDEFLRFIEEVDIFIGHNLLGYDVYVMNKILGTKIKVSQVEDTLVMSRLFRPVTPFKEQLNDPLIIDNRLGGHSLEAWGLRLGYNKIHFNDFSKFSEEMLTYCIRDVDLNLKVYEVLQKEREGFSDLSIRIEHNTAWILSQQEKNGFYLDQEACIKLRDETGVLIDNMSYHLRKLFPPKKKVIRNWSPSYVDEPQYEEYLYTFKSGKKAGQTVTKKRVIVGEDGHQLKIKRLSKTSEKILKTWCHDKLEDGSYNLYVMEEFNPASSTQVGQRLIDLGWVPKKLTPKGSPATDKDSLREALGLMSNKYSEVKYLADYNIISDRFQKANKWLSLVKEDGRVHGRINPIGAGTHRCSHYDDNMANIAAVQLKTKSLDQFLKDTKGTHPSTLRPYTPFKDKGFVFVEYNKDKDEVDVALTGREGGYGWESRSCWAAPPGKVLIGSDASGIQLRGLAHYMNDKEYTRKLLEDDIHTVNQHAAGLPTRKKAKTFIYSFLLGAGDEKTGELVGLENKEEINSLIEWSKNQPHPYNSREDLLTYVKRRLKKEGRKIQKQTVATILKGNKVKRKFLERTPALKRLKEEEIPEATKKGYLIGLDGRKLWIPNEHLALSLYLQGFEAVVMKVSMGLWHMEANKRRIPFKQTAYVHDEWVIETLPECADELGSIVSSSYRKAGELLNVNCPLDGAYAIGPTWAHIH